MSPEWTLTFAVLLCTALIVTRSPTEAWPGTPSQPDGVAWHWDASHRCRLSLQPLEPAEGGLRVRIRNDTVFAVRLDLEITAGDGWHIADKALLHPGSVTERIVRRGPIAIAVPDCRRRL